MLYAVCGGEVPFAEDLATCSFEIIWRTLVWKYDVTRNYEARSCRFETCCEPVAKRCRQWCCASAVEYLTAVKIEDEVIPERVVYRSGPVYRPSSSTVVVLLNGGVGILHQVACHKSHYVSDSKLGLAHSFAAVSPVVDLFVLAYTGIVGIQ
jgi:hypothetical protein